MVYITSSGDMWDKIAFEQMGSEGYMGDLIRMNDGLVDVVVFPAGVRIEIPEIDGSQTELPSWRDGIAEDDDDLDEFEEDDEYGQR